MASVLRRAALILLVCVAGGCGGSRPPAIITIDPPADWKPPSGEDIVLGVGDVIEVSYFKSYDEDRVYRLAPGDKLQVVVNTQRTDQPYRLGVGDRIEVVVKRGVVQGPYRILPDGRCTLPLLGAVRLKGLSVEQARQQLAELYRKHYTDPTVDLLIAESGGVEIKEEVTILPDGSCTVPMLGVIPLSPLSVEEASEMLRRRYQELFYDPRVDVLVVESRERIDDFFSILLKSPLGSFQRVSISAENVLELPLIKTIHPLNRTLQEVRAEIESSYALVLPDVDIAVNLSSTLSKRQIAVMGEVVSGGLLDAPRAVSPLTAIAMAGGFKVTAQRSQVLLVHIEPNGSLTVHTLDLKSGLSMDDPSSWHIKVQPFDLVYVPMSKIANVNLFVKQYITDLIPDVFKVGVGIEYQVQKQ